MPKISIIVPVFNMEKYLEKSLSSFVHQTFSDIEIIIVDDGSKDGSSKIYDEFASRDNRIKIVKKENAGVSEARNTGIMEASGDFLMFADPDDWMESKCCETLYNEQLRTGADMVLADVNLFRKRRKVNFHLFAHAFTTSDPQLIKLYQKTCIGYSYNPDPEIKWITPGLGSPWNKLFKRSIIVTNGLKFDPYVKGIYDDNLFVLHYLMNVKVLSYIQESVYNYVLFTESVTRSYKKDTLEINKRIFKRINDFINETGDKDFFKDALNVNIIRRLTRTIDTYFFADNNPKAFNEKCKELKNIIKQEPYHKAIYAVKMNKLNLNDKVIVFFARQKAPRLIWIGVKIRRILD